MENVNGGGKGCGRAYLGYYVSLASCFTGGGMLFGIVGMAMAADSIMDCDHSQFAW